MQVPRHVRGQALLVYDTRAASHVAAVKRVLDEVGICWLSSWHLLAIYVSACLAYRHRHPHLSSRLLTYVAVW